MRQTVSFEEVIMSKDKYVQQMEAIVFIILHIFLSWKKTITNDHIFATHGMFTFLCCLVQLHERTNMSLFGNNS